MTDKTDYAMSSHDASILQAIVLVPADLRRELLSNYLAEHGPDSLVNLLAEFIGLANSVVSNNREMLELLGITHGDMHPHTVEQFNLPTIFGALGGVKLANFVDGRRTCGGCAFRKGTPANQCPPTVIDAEWTQNEPAVGAFLCHEAEGAPKKVCRGFGQAMRKRRRARAGSGAREVESC